jgi:hypothetical protein
VGGLVLRSDADLEYIDCRRRDSVDCLRDSEDSLRDSEDSLRDSEDSFRESLDSLLLPERGRRKSFEFERDLSTLTAYSSADVPRPRAKLGRRLSGVELGSRGLQEWVSRRSQ